MTQRTEDAIRTIYDFFEDEKLSAKDFAEKASAYFKDNGFTFRESSEIMDKVNAMRGVLPLP